MDDTRDEAPVPQGTPGGISALHLRKDKAWVYRVISVHALADRPLSGALQACIDALRGRDDAEMHDERTIAVLEKAVDMLGGEKIDQDASLLSVFGAAGFYLDARETPFLDIPVLAVADSRVRWATFDALADLAGE